MKYSEKLKHPKWQRKRLEIMSRDNFTCVLCSDSESELHVHHIKYNGEPWEASSNNLETICKTCHFIKHCLSPDLGRYVKAKIFNGNKRVYHTAEGHFHLWNCENEPMFLLSISNGSEIVKYLYQNFTNE